MRVGLLHRDRVVGRDPGEVEVLGGGVHEHDRQTQLQKPRVVVVRSVGLGVLPAREHHSRNLALEQHLDVLGLGHAPGARAENGIEAALRKRAGDDLGERREDRVLKLRHDEPDHARAPDPQVRRPFVADDVERGEHGRARRVRDPGLAVEDAADGRLAHTGLLRDVGEPPRHRATVRQTRASPGVLGGHQTSRPASPTCARDLRACSRVDTASLTSRKCIDLSDSCN